MRFILMAGPGENPAPAADMTDELFATYMRFNEELTKAGVLVASEGLNPAAAPAKVVRAGAKRRVVDGPYAEAKELVGGFWLIDVPSREDAIAWALKAPVGLGSDDVLEIRQLTGAGDIPPEYLAIIRKVAPTWSATFPG
jgi:hypothetical protein